MSDTEVHGGCMCEDIRYVATSAPKHTSVCHCRYDRKATGGHVVGWVTFPRDKFSFVKGKPAEYVSSLGVIRTFCPRCGTSLTYTNARWPDNIDVTTGSTDNPQDFPPKEQVRLEDKLPWV